MNELKSIVGGAFRNRLAALTHKYLKMQSMASNDRDSYLNSLMCYADEIQSRIDGSETQRAKLILLKFQYASRIIYSVDEQIISHFCDRLKWEKWEEGKEILSWRFTPPSSNSRDIFILNNQGVRIVCKARETCWINWQRIALIYHIE